MSKSYEKINYSLRPAKNILRKMLVDVFRRLSDFTAVRTYRYIGFGSPYFSDFILFHRALGINKMISIEHDTDNEYRFRFNCPFNCIKLYFDEASNVLPTLSWETKTILWLDYDYRLTRSVLEDVAFFCASAAPGSVLVVTVDAQPDKLDPKTVPSDRNYAKELLDYRLRNLVDDVGEKKIPSGINGSDLAGWEKADTYHSIIANEIQEQLDNRNGGRTDISQLEFKQLFNLRYADGAKMLTVGGLLYEEGQSAIVSKCDFDDLFYVVDVGNEPFHIDVPLLTYREIRHLDTLLPVDIPEEFVQAPFPNKDTRNYARIYRYFPTFAEAEL